MKHNALHVGMVFGVFDGLHSGHLHFLRESLKRCDKLFVVVTPSEVVLILKKRHPKYSFNDRIEALRAQNLEFSVVGGDLVLGTWAVIKKHKPSVVFLGHDQQGIAEALKKINIPFEFISPHYPDKFKSSILNTENA